MAIVYSLRSKVTWSCSSPGLFHFMCGFDWITGMFLAFHLQINLRLIFNCFVEQLTNRSIMICWKPLKFLFETRNTSNSELVWMDSRLLFSLVAMMSKSPTKFYFRTSCIPTFPFWLPSSQITIKVLFATFLFEKATPSLHVYCCPFTQWNEIVCNLLS